MLCILTKFALRALIEGYRNEFQQYNIKTTNMQPGFVESKFWDEFSPGNKPLLYEKKNALSVNSAAELINESIQINCKSNLQ